MARTTDTKREAEATEATETNGNGSDKAEDNRVALAGRVDPKVKNIIDTVASVRGLKQGDFVGEILTAYVRENLQSEEIRQQLLDALTI